MTVVRRKFLNPSRHLPLANFNRQIRAVEPSLKVSLPYHPTLSKPIKKILRQHDVKVTHSSGVTLRNILSKTKTTPPSHITPNAIYETPCDGCNGFYDGQTSDKEDGRTRTQRQIKQRYRRVYRTDKIGPGSPRQHYWSQDRLQQNTDPRFHQNEGTTRPY